MKHICCTDVRVKTGQLMVNLWSLWKMALLFTENNITILVFVQEQVSAFFFYVNFSLLGLSFEVPARKPQSVKSES